MIIEIEIDVKKYEDAADFHEFLTIFPKETSRVEITKTIQAAAQKAGQTALDKIYAELESLSKAKERFQDESQKEIKQLFGSFTAESQ